MYATYHPHSGRLLCYHSDAIYCCHLSEMRNALFYVKAMFSVFRPNILLHVLFQFAITVSMEIIGYLLLIIKL